MKRLSLFILAAIILCLSFSEEKKFTVSFTQPEWEARYSWIEVAKSQLKSNNLPVKDVLFITDSLLGRLQNELAAQLRPQFVADTVKKKSK